MAGTRDGGEIAAAMFAKDQGPRTKDKTNTMPGEPSFVLRPLSFALVSLLPITIPHRHSKLPKFS
jgi:hypothetical protein